MALKTANRFERKMLTFCDSINSKRNNCQKIFTRSFVYLNKQNSVKLLYSDPNTFHKPKILVSKQAYLKQILMFNFQKFQTVYQIFNNRFRLLKTLQHLRFRESYLSLKINVLHSAFIQIVPTKTFFHSFHHFFQLTGSFATCQ